MAEVRENLALNASFTPMPPEERRALEARLARHAWRYDGFKRD